MMLIKRRERIMKRSFLLVRLCSGSESCLSSVGDCFQFLEGGTL